MDAWLKARWLHFLQGSRGGTEARCLEGGDLAAALTGKDKGRLQWESRSEVGLVGAEQWADQ